MAAIPKIPLTLRQYVLAKANEGKSSEEIAALLWAEHRFEVKSRVVRYWIKKQRTELADVAKVVVREEIRKRLLPALRRAARAGIQANQIGQRLSKQSALARAEQDVASSAGFDMATLKAIDRVVKVADLLMHYAGLDQPDDPKRGKTAAERREAVLKRLEDLARPQQPAEPEETQVN